MNILFITNNYKPYNGGVVSSIDAFSDQLKTLGHSVKIVTLDFTGTHALEHNVIRLYSPIRFKYRQNPIAVPLFIKKQLATIFEQEKPDVIHTHHPFILGPVATQLAKERSIPVFFTHHSQYGQYAHYYAPVLPQLTRSIVEHKVHSFCKSVDHIIAPTDSIKRQLEAQQINTPLSVLASGILPIFNCQKKPEKTINKKSFELLTVSRFVPEKNITFLFDVMKLLPEQFKLTLIGFGPELDYLQEYALAHCTLNPERIRFIVKPPKTIIANYYKKADLFIFASTTETQGLVFAESMAAGTPVIAVKAPGAQDCIKDSYNGFLISTAQEMAEKITLLASDQKRYQQFSEHAFTTAQEYQMEAVTKKLINLYNRYY